MTRRMIVATLSCLLAAFELTPQLFGQTKADSRLLEEISKIKAIDNHAHVPKLVGESEKPDDEYDALPCDKIEPFALPARITSDMASIVAAWRLLYGYSHDDVTEERVGQLIQSKRRVIGERGDQYPSWVLDKLGIEVMLANRISMGRGLPSPRFRWVSYVDAFLFPLSNEAARKSNPDRAIFFEREQQLLRRYVTESKLGALPLTLKQYLASVVTATLERQRRDGAVAVKFEAAYLRPLDFDEASEPEAARVYAQYIRGGTPPAAQYKTLQDFIFRHVAREAGRLGLVVHIHTGPGCGSYFKLAGSNPILLDSALNDPSLRKTNFVLVHGGWPWTKEVAFMVGKPNVYADFSVQPLLLYPREVSEHLRVWLAWFPDKIMFGTDTSPGSPEASWEEQSYLTISATRQALAFALTAMMSDGEVTRDRALELARMVLRDNASKLYGFKSN